MPAKQPKVGPFSAVYIGLYGSTDPLVKLKSVRTDGTELLSGFDEVELACKAFNSEQAGLVDTQIPITFYGTAKEIYSLAMGTWNPTYKDAASTLSEYTLLLVHPNRDGDDHLYLPRVKTKKSLKSNYNKNRPTILPVLFNVKIRNRFQAVQPWYQRKLTGDAPNDLQTIIGVRYPL